MRLAEWTKEKRPAPEPLEGNPVVVVATGTVVWAVLFVAQLPFYGWYADHGHTWWLWTCLTGAVLGVYGLWFVRRREAALHADRERRAGQPPRDGDQAAG
jgi:hypothetical protein